MAMARDAKIIVIIYLKCILNDILVADIKVVFRPYGKEVVTSRRACILASGQLT